MKQRKKSVIDRCLPLVYQKYFADPKPENMPVLGDLYDCLRKQKEPQAQRIATALEIYVNGSLKVFNHRTNVELNNRIVCFDIKELGKQLKRLECSSFRIRYGTELRSTVASNLPGTISMSFIFCSKKNRQQLIP